MWKPPSANSAHNWNSFGGDIQVLLARLLSAARAPTSRPAKDRAALATAFIAFAGVCRVCRKPVTAAPASSRHRSDPKPTPDRSYCPGFHSHPRPRAHSRRSDGEEACREGCQTAKKGSKSKRRKGAFARVKASERGKRIDRQAHQTLPVMLADLPQQCDLGAKTNSQGNQEYWRGYKLHLDVADGQIPISVILTSASVSRFTGGHSVDDHDRRACHASV